MGNTHTHSWIPSKKFLFLSSTLENSRMTAWTNQLVSLGQTGQKVEAGNRHGQWVLPTCAPAGRCHRHCHVSLTYPLFLFLLYIFFVQPNLKCWSPWDQSSPPCTAVFSTVWNERLQLQASSHEERSHDPGQGDWHHLDLCSDKGIPRNAMCSLLGFLLRR